MERKSNKTKYDPIFNTDWNQGNNSILSSMERARIHQLYLDYLHETTISTPTELEPQVRGIDNDRDDIQQFVRF
jgi:hypothetical protein